MSDRWLVDMAQAFHTVRVSCATEKVAGELAQHLVECGIEFRYEPPYFALENWTFPSFSFKRKDALEALAEVDNFEKEKYST